MGKFKYEESKTGQQQASRQEVERARADDSQAQVAWSAIGRTMSLKEALSTDNHNA